LQISKETLADIRRGSEFVSASFVTPYPPGFPLLVPGQVVSPEIIAFLLAIDVKEIHGHHPLYGIRVFTQASIDRAASASKSQSLVEKG
jgi:arginine decarboxylase